MPIVGGGGGGGKRVGNGRGLDSSLSKLNGVSIELVNFLCALN